MWHERGAFSVVAPYCFQLINNKSSYICMYINPLPPKLSSSPPPLHRWQQHQRPLLYSHPVSHSIQLRFTCTWLKYESVACNMPLLQQNMFTSVGTWEVLRVRQAEICGCHICVSPAGKYDECRFSQTNWDRSQFAYES